MTPPVSSSPLSLPAYSVDCLGYYGKYESSDTATGSKPCHVILHIVLASHVPVLHLSMRCTDVGWQNRVLLHCCLLY